MSKKILLRLIALLALLLLPFTGKAEGDFMIGIGASHQADTYLSPQEYHGPQMSLLWLTERPLKRNEHVLFRTHTFVQYTSLHRIPGFVAEHSGDVAFAFGWDRKWTDVALRLSLALGGQAETSLGGTYNRRNGNNPANARLGLMAGLHASASYLIYIRKQRLPLEYDLQSPLLGGAFSPQYGQSYYNLFEQGRYDHNALCTHWGNTRSLRQRLTLSFPLSKSESRSKSTSKNLTLGYLCDIRQQRLHNITQRQTTHSLLIGISL